MCGKKKLGQKFRRVYYDEFKKLCDEHKFHKNSKKNSFKEKQFFLKKESE